MTLLLGLFFSAIGGAYLVYGKQQHDPTCLVAGFLLAIYPYFFSNAFLIVLIGVLIAAVPIARAKGLF